MTGELFAAIRLIERAGQSAQLAALRLNSVKNLSFLIRAKKTSDCHCPSEGQKWETPVFRPLVYVGAESEQPKYKMLPFYYVAWKPPQGGFPYLEIFEVPDLELSIAERTLDSMAEFQENFSYLATGELLMNIKSMPHSPLEYNAVRGESLRILANRFADVKHVHFTAFPNFAQMLNQNAELSEYSDFLQQSPTVSGGEFFEKRALIFKNERKPHVIQCDTFAVTVGNLKGRAAS